MKELISKEQIAVKIKTLAAEIDAAYKNKDLAIVMVLKGAICLCADLIRELHIPNTLDIVQCSSYGEKGTARGELSIFGVDRLHIHNRDVLLIDDIFDSGHTLSTLVTHLKEKQPRSLKTLVLLSKNVEHTTTYRPDYVLFPIENQFVVGYGLDYKEQYRGLPGVYIYQ